MNFRGEASEHFISRPKWQLITLTLRYSHTVRGEFYKALRNTPYVTSPYVTEYTAVNKISNGTSDMCFLSDMLRFEAAR